MYENTNPPARGATTGAGLILVAVSIAQLTVALDLSIVNVALPAIQDALGFSAANLAWVLNAYTLAFGGLLLLGGRLGDLLGRRRVFLASAVLFGVSSAIGGFADSPGLLIAARALQGVGAAGMAPAALSLLMTTFPEGAERTKALTIWTIVSVLGGAIGVLLGGILADFASWRWVLLVNVPIVLGMLAVAWRALPRDTRRPRDTTSRPDVAGALLATVGMTTLVLGVVRTHEHGWGSATTVATLATAVALLVAFVWVETKIATAPLVRIGLLAKRGPAVANVVMMLICSGQFAAFYFVSLQVQTVMDRSPAVTGLIFLPFCVGVVAGSMSAMKAVGRFGVRPPIVSGALLGAVGMLWLGQADANATFLGSLLGPMLLASFGIGLCIVPTTTAATAGVAPEEAGMASGIVNSARQVGGAIGLAALVTIAAAHETAQRAAGETPLQALSDGQQLGMTVAAGVIAAAALVALLLGRPGDPARAQHHRS